jgi:hypothetical protein
MAQRSSPLMCARRDERPRTSGNAFWAGFGGPCETRNDGDIIIQYDKAAGRWIAAQPVFVEPFMYCIAVSTTPDATGSYHRYAFQFPAGDFPDYPKLGVWSDAYYASFNIFDPKFAGAMACAYERAKMLAGAAATAVCFQQPSNVSSLLPSDLDSKLAPPAGAPNFMVGLARCYRPVLFQIPRRLCSPGKLHIQWAAADPGRTVQRDLQSLENRVLYTGAADRPESGCNF